MFRTVDTMHVQPENRGSESSHWRSSPCSLLVTTTIFLKAMRIDTSIMNKANEHKIKCAEDFLFHYVVIPEHSSYWN